MSDSGQPCGTRTLARQLLIVFGLTAVKIAETAVR